ncbi:MAG: cyclase family protein [Kofleriaceae bacterium]
MLESAQFRAVFDFHITFSNGGELTGAGFRLDVPSETITAHEVGQLLVRKLGLLMVATVELRAWSIVAEPHREPVPASSAPVARRLVDVSHPIAHGMVTYPGLPGPELTDHLTRDAAEQAYGPGVRFHIGRISMIANTGTYLDSPFHRFDGGVDLAGLPLEKLAALDGVVVRLSGSRTRAIGVAELVPYDVAGRAVLLHTGWDRHWGTPAYGVDAPFLTAEATRWLVEQGAALVGIDSINIDDVADRARPAHTGLLGAGIPIVEHLCRLSELPVTGFAFHAAPPAVEQFGTFPVRAYAVIG